MSSSPLASLVEVYKALAHPARLRILAMLRDGELCVCQFTAVLALAASTVSAHLTELRRAGLIEERKKGRWVFYRLGDDAHPAALLDATWPTVDGDAQIAADTAIVRQLREVSPEALCRVDLDLERAGVRLPVLATATHSPRKDRR